MAKRYTYPQCTMPGCDHKRTWKTEAAARHAFNVHGAWVRPDGHAICFCHGLEQGATFPCDETERDTAHA